MEPIILRQLWMERRHQMHPLSKSDDVRLISFYTGVYVEPGERWNDVGGKTSDDLDWWVVWLLWEEAQHNLNMIQYQRVQETTKDE